ncbi:hypothetical protein [Sphingosinicella microcystinivorans]|uniref:hypothetical protein n=1 Tax=Sphingosinicella microcystinivorans TaxID=335406 RepID=UPI0022F3BF88|nr:hypothetical protein [Sphingosinicella microcystinivorans]WBX85669.1 hypothetical protein PE061_07095 [Sphingosinicella microcystinivorans]
MIKQVIFIAFLVVMAGFIWWRFYVSMRDQMADVRGAIYVRQEQPLLFWFSTSMMAVGATLISLIALTLGYGAISGSLD